MPNYRTYSEVPYIFWYVNNIIFAYAVGMQKISIRLSQERDLDTNKLESPDSFYNCNSWYAVPYNSNDLGILVKSAYESAIKS